MIKCFKSSDIVVGLATAIVVYLIMTITTGFDEDMAGEIIGLTIYSFLLGLFIPALVRYAKKKNAEHIENYRKEWTCAKCGTFDQWDHYEECIGEEDVERLVDRDSRGYPCQPFYMHGKRYTYIYRHRCKKCGFIKSDDEEFYETQWNGF